MIGSPAHAGIDLQRRWQTLIMFPGSPAHAGIDLPFSDDNAMGHVLHRVRVSQGSPAHAGIDLREYVGIAAGSPAHSIGAAPIGELLVPPHTRG